MAQSRLHPGSVASDAAAPAGSSHRSRGEGVTLKLATDRVLGTGSFGVVFEAVIEETREVVAIKKVLQDARFKNRELGILKSVSHPNIVTLRHYFYQQGEKEDEVYLNLVMEYIPDTVHKVARYYAKQRQIPPLLLIKLYVYQMLRSLAYLHASGTCHRDIKPQNLLVNTRTHVLKLCDFGSAKTLTPGEASVAYICSRYYRAPELIFGATDYTCAIDVWSAACVFGEMFLGLPMFPGETGVDQLVEIMKVMGSPSREQVLAMHPQYTDFSFAKVKPVPLDKFFKGRADAAAVDLLARMLTYVPATRITAMDACAHHFFDELRDPATRLPDGAPLPPLFNFTSEEVDGLPPATLEVLLPPHARTASTWSGAAVPRAVAYLLAPEPAAPRAATVPPPAAGGSAGATASAAPRTSTSTTAVSAPSAAAAAATSGSAAAGSTRPPGAGVQEKPNKG